MELAREFSFDETAREDVWTLFKYIISEKRQLTSDNHLDQLLLCSFYAVGRMVFKSELTFATLFHRYRNARYASRKFCDLKQLITVRVTNEKNAPESIQQIEIIPFYNALFIKETEECLGTLSSVKLITSNKSTPSPAGNVETPEGLEETTPGKSSANKKSVFSALDLESPLCESVPQSHFGQGSTPGCSMKLSGLNSTLTPRRAVHIKLKAGRGEQSPFFIFLCEQVYR